MAVVTPPCAEISMVIEILKVLPTAIVGAIAAYIAWRQAEIAKEQREISNAKLRLDLFEKRLAVFHATWDAASRFIQTNTQAHLPASMTNLYPEASFLFGPEVELYMKELGQKMIRLSIIRRMTEHNNNVVPPDTLKELTVLEKSIFDAASSGIRATFSPYLDFARWR